MLIDLYSKLSRFDDRNALMSRAYNYYLNEEDYDNIANLYIHIGEKGKAIEIYKKIIELDTYNNIDCTDYYVKIADIYKEINQENTAKEYYQKAIDIYEDKLKTDDSGYYLGLLCNLYMTIGNKDKSILYYKEYIEILIKESKAEMENEARENISWSKALEIAASYRKIGDTENAIKYYEYALYDNADLEYCYDSIAEIYDEINEKEKSKEYYQNSIELHKKYFETHSYHCDSLKEMAKLYLKIDDKEKAEECYKKVLDINIYDNEAKEYLEKLNI
ncbi:tetratricopeptide repeat protein [Brachyspira hyodysenteriae]|nr:tetratricopeptide repeat protein [Brachyspira hyodysenteriae]MDA0062155.1 tetratricopeptide repeat protein [Brachyspira hyodysenteriae]MDA0065917.1 tetratricopeptide repeat protein [Brachyspira hyodysenteriae]MDA0071008.1 tetratricopeptide repeat protein [Brachyspira hyodysenteriae]MDA0088883.1 tetratricopeptide repeat protein [Brachyspira hyodysenteriae]MDA0095128.1 tetratricopeptide repeat protein [Brachyspira hyodysenteriae]